LVAEHEFPDQGKRTLQIRRHPGRGKKPLIARRRDRIRDLVEGHAGSCRRFFNVNGDRLG
jgi:hypothetical protein